MSIILHSHTSWLAVKLVCLAGVGLSQRGQRALEELSATKVFVLLSSEFRHLFEEGRTELSYDGIL